MNFCGNSEIVVMCIYRRYFFWLYDLVRIENTNLLFTGESDLNDNLSFLTAENIFQFRTARMKRGMMPLRTNKTGPLLFLCTCEQIPCPKLIVDYVMLVQSQSSQRVIVAEKFQSFT